MGGAFGGVIMWDVSGYNLQMTKGDYGLALPILISGTTLGAQDSIKLTFKTAVNGNEILEKTFDGITDNTVSLELTEAESALFPVGQYVYRLDWYQNGSFMCNIIPSAQFKVVNKA